ncbi:MAG: hydrogenase maturation nickel metallochaperone HypA [Planctomycetaceae bacterium]|nr:MAG: hydrogenase maturation nickel metallochaperone HypA [Planctomycetaceae bacterium]
MHEAGIAEGILSAALDSLPKDRTGKMKIIKIVISAGVLSGVEEESLTMYLTALGEGTPAQGAKLEMKISPAKLVCRACGNSVNYNAAGPVDIECRKCGGPNGLEGGREEIVLETLEVQTDD